jgi:RTA1 like protein
MAHDDMTLRFFGYHPNKAGAAIALIAFLAAAVVTSVLNVKTRTRFTWIVTITALLEMVGYAARFQMMRSPSLGNFVIMQSLLVITPTLLAVAVYLVVGKLMMLADNQQMGCLTASRIGTIFSCRYSSASLLYPLYTSPLLVALMFKTPHRE